MSFNVWIILAVIFGQAVGFLLLALLGRIGLRQGWALFAAPARPAPPQHAHHAQLAQQGHSVRPPGGGRDGAAAPDDAALAGKAASELSTGGAARAKVNGWAADHLVDSARSGTAYLAHSDGGSCCSGNNDSVSVGRKVRGLLAHLTAVPEWGNGGGGGEGGGEGGEGGGRRKNTGQESNGDYMHSTCGCN